VRRATVVLDRDVRETAHENRMELVHCYLLMLVQIKVNNEISNVAVAA